MWSSARPGTLRDDCSTLQQALRLSGIIVEPNVGGGMPSELVARSMLLFAQEVAPRLREA